jgi:hypothetical protein
MKARFLAALLLAVTAFMAIPAVARANSFDGQQSSYNRRHRRHRHHHPHFTE